MKRVHPEPVDNGQLSRPNHSFDLDRDGLVTPMSDGVRLRSDLYLPAGPGPWPVLLERTPYNKESSVEVTQAKSPEYFASRGYAVVVQDTRGRFKSEGEFYPFRDDGWGEHRDGYDTVEWLAEQTWCDGKIGTLGGSYAGHTQYAMAPTAPPHLAAQFARHSISDFHDGWIFRGGAFELRFNVDWAIVQAISQVERMPGDPSKRDDRKRLLQDALYERSTWYEFLPLRDLPLFRDVAPWFYDWLEQPDDGEYWRRWNVASRHESVEVPICHFGSWFDTFLKGTVDNFTGISRHARSKRARQNQRMILGPWFHGPTTANHTRYGDFDFGPDAGVDFNKIRLPWFDYWLKGIDNSVNVGPPVQYYTMGASRWQTAGTWPLPDTSNLALYFSPGRSGSADSLNDGRLSEDLPSGTRGADRYIYNPSDPVRAHGGAMIGYPWHGPEYEAFCGPFDERPVEGRCLTYTGESLERDLEVTGPVSAMLFASSSVPDTDWVVRLSDVSPDGSARPVAEGILRARYRDSASVQILMEPGEAYMFLVDLWATSNLFKRGHRIRVMVTSSWFPRWDRNLNTGGPFGREIEGRVAENVIHRDRFRPSHITLPVRSA